MQPVLACPVQVFHYSIWDKDGCHREDTGSVALTDNDEALNFGRAVVRDLMRGNIATYAGWTVNVVQGKRTIGKICLVACDRTKLSRPVPQLTPSTL
jgi:hypothetical protein